MSKEAKYLIAFCLAAFFALIIAGLCWQHREFLKCAWWYGNCVTLKRNNANYKLEVVHKLAQARSVYFLRRMLEDKDRYIRQSVAFDLADMDDAHCAQELFKMALDGEEDVYVRLDAAKSLGALSDRHVVEALAAALKSADDFTYDCVAIALKKVDDVDNAKRDALKKVKGRVKEK